MITHLPRTISKWDGYALLLLACLFALCMEAGHHMHGIIPDSVRHPVPLDPKHLPFYALLTFSRMMIGIVCSLIFTILYATLAAKVKRLTPILIPLLDILQSVPVLGYLSFTVAGFASLFPGNLLGLELVVIFAIFTAQTWNMTFSLYQSLISIPKDLLEAASVFGLTSWQRFWTIELPYAVPGLIWNAMVSMSGAWFFIVASEAVTIGNTQFYLPGMGSYIASAINAMDFHAVINAILTMLATIILYDQVLFRPLTEWAQKYRYETVSSCKVTSGWCYQLLQRVRIIRLPLYPLRYLCQRLYHFRLPASPALLEHKHTRRVWHFLYDVLYYAVLTYSTIYGLAYLWKSLGQHITFFQLKECFFLGFLTLLRILCMMVLVVIIWIPIGIYIGLRPNLAARIQPLVQILAAFPSNFLYPIFVLLLANYHLNPNIWLSPLIIFGTQWYLLFNVIAGTSAFPHDLKELAANLQLKGKLWWGKFMLPGIFPYVITGLITSWGGAWNATIVAEIISWGHKHYEAEGLGSYITQASDKGDFVSVAAGIIMMVLYVVTFNRLLWRPLYHLAESRFKMN